MHAVATGLADALAKAGGRISYGRSVDEVVLADGDRGTVRGVRTAGDLVTADAVVVNADLPGAYGLLPGIRPPASLRRARYSPSAVVWHAGVRGRPAAGHAHHNIHFGHAWRRAFRDLDDGRRMSDPSLLVSVPTLSDPELAPPGCSVLYTLEPVPNLTGGLDWARLRATVRSELSARIQRLGYPVDTVEESLVDPVDWARQGLAAGTPFSLSHRFSQSGPFRPSNVDDRVPRPRVRRNRHRPGGRRPHGAAVGQAGRRAPGAGRMILPARRVRSARSLSARDLAVPTALRDAYRECRRLTRRHGTTYYWATQVLPATPPPRAGALRLLPARRRDRRRPRRRVR